MPLFGCPQTKTGGSVSRIMTLKLHEETRPLQLVAVQMTVFVPTGKLHGLGGGTVAGRSVGPDRPGGADFPDLAGVRRR